MRILFLGPEPSPVLDFLRKVEDHVDQSTERLILEPGVPIQWDFLVSFGYRHLIRREVLDRFGANAINLHISYLPWNRGSDPNFWSFMEDTPKGVTIHQIDENFDTGPILVQKEVYFEDTETLSTTYTRLIVEISELFFEKWPEIRLGKIPARPQTAEGTIHRLKDKEEYSHLYFEKGWDTPVSKITQYGRNVYLEKLRQKKVPLPAEKVRKVLIDGA